MTKIKGLERELNGICTEVEIVLESGHLFLYGHTMLKPTGHENFIHALPGHFGKHLVYRLEGESEQTASTVLIEISRLIMAIAAHYAEIDTDRHVVDYVRRESANGRLVDQHYPSDDAGSCFKHLFGRDATADEEDVFSVFYSHWVKVFVEHATRNDL